MKNLGYIAGEITKGKNLEDNLTKYATGMASMYNSLAYIKMSMNYFTILDIVRENSKDERVDLFVNKVNDLIGSFVLNSDYSYEDAVKAIEEVRDDLIKTMEMVTTYVDRLRIYEYVLNRIEFRFTEGEPDLKYYNNDLTNDLMHYILSDGDNVVINSKISEIVGQLPVRMPKALFFDHIRDAYTLYHGAQKKTIDDFYYTLSTSAMIGKVDGMEDVFPEIEDIVNTLCNADYQKADFDEFNRLRGALDIATEKMTCCADTYVLLTQIVNDVYTICLTNNNSLDSIEENEIAKKIISGIKASFEDDLDFDEIAEDFVHFEGKQERIFETVSSGDYAIEYVVNNYKDLLESNNLFNAYNGLLKATKLQSGSDFVSLDFTDVIDQDIPDDSYADSVADKLIIELEKVFEGKATIVKRAIMATILSSIPVFFNNTEEIQSYINNSLIQCNDSAEQKAVIELMKMLMEQ